MHKLFLNLPIDRAISVGGFLIRATRITELNADYEITSEDRKPSVFYESLPNGDKQLTNTPPKA